MSWQCIDITMRDFSLAPVQLQGRPLRDSDIGPGLEGQRAEMFWPDDNLWYLVEVNTVDMRTHQVCMR
jgi:hypothetical protein